MNPRSSERFTSRVADYVRYRPGYPAAATDVLVKELPLGPTITVADVGAGTGILTLALLRSGADVIAVDPNERMLAAARDYLRGHDNLRIVVGAAEATGLADRSVDAMTAGQAFHWFDHARARAEFLRVLKPNGRVALVWNATGYDASAFLAGYQRLLDELVPEFATVRHERTGQGKLDAFFGAPPERYDFPHEQRFDWPGVLGRVASSSYAPKPGEQGHQPLVDELSRLFAAHSADGAITWSYTTTVYLGPLG